MMAHSELENTRDKLYYRKEINMKLFTCLKLEKSKDKIYQKEYVLPL